MQNAFIRPLGATALVAFAISASSLHAAASGTAYDGFNYTAGNMANPTTTPASALTGGTGWDGNGAVGGSGTPTTWGITLAGNNTTAVSTNPRFALNNNVATVASANQQIIGTSLSYPGLATSGGAVQIGNVSSTASVGRNFGQNIDSGTFYFSYLVQKTVNTLRTTNVGFFGLVDNATAPLERVSIGQIGSNTNYMDAAGVNNSTTAVPPANQGDFQVLNSNPLAATSSVYKTGGAMFGRNATTNPNSVLPQTMTLNTTFMVVGKFEFNVGANTTDDRLTLYLNPTSLASEGDNSAYLVITGVDFGTLVGFRMFNGSSGAAGFEAPTAIYDEFHFGTSFLDVTTVPVPEPGTAVLGGVLGLLLLQRLRRRRA